jgi:hypothetical protein
MEDSSPITPELRENLVAYLDGELDEVSTLEIERTLSESAEIRQEVEALSRTWELLDALPRVEVSQDFTERTLASVQTASVPEMPRPLLSPTARRNLGYATLLAGGVICALAGFLLANRGIPLRSDPLVRDLPVIQQLDLYQDVGDVKFLKELEKMGILTDGQSEFQNPGH